MTFSQLLLVAASLVGPALGCGDEILQEFKRYFRKYKEPAERVEAVLALEGVEQAEVVDLLLPVLRDMVPQVVWAAVQVLGAFEEPGPVEHLLEVLGKQKKAEVRIGLLQAIQKGGYGPLGESVYDCLGDRSWEIRRQAAITLGAAGAEAGAEFLVPL